MNRTGLDSLCSATFAAALAFGGGVALAPHCAAAAFLSSGSEINSVGAINDLLPTSGGSGTLASDATGIDFANNSLIALVASGELAAFINVGGTIQDIPEGTLPMAGGVAYATDNFYTYTSGADTLAFDLGSIINVMRDATGLSGLLVSGTGTLRATIGGVVYDPTPALYELSVQGDGSTTFSSSTVSSGGTEPIPEPASLALFGLGLMGIAAAARRRRQGEPSIRAARRRAAPPQRRSRISAAGSSTRSRPKAITKAAATTRHPKNRASSATPAAPRCLILEGSWRRGCSPGFDAGRSITAAIALSSPSCRATPPSPKPPR